MIKKEMKSRNAVESVLPGASKELSAMLGNFRVTSSELRRTLGKPAKLYVRLEELVKPTQLQMA